jgi:hypothetical protein
MAQDDDDRTLMGPRPQLGPLAAQRSASAAQPGSNVLPAGTLLHEFEIQGLVGEGGFGIVYLAYDRSLKRKVALKEYMPSSFASRSGQVTVSVKSDRYAETFKAGLRSFVNEAQLLAQFDHPSLVKVFRFWEANGTAYMVMPYYEGTTLKQTIVAMAESPDESWLKTLLAPLLDALDLLHRNRCYHRDIAPDNILLLPEGRPVLLDFGAARRVISDMTHALTVILKPGYAPVEQYAEVPGLKQGGWTDVYALAAVVYYCIMRKAPLPSVARMMNETLTPLAQAAAGRYSDAFLSAIDRALAVRPEARIQTIAELRTQLGIEETPVPTQRLRAQPRPAPAAEAVREAPAPPLAPPPPQADRPLERPKPAQPAESAAKRGRLPLIAGAGVALVAALAVALYLILSPERKAPPPGPPLPPATTAPKVEPEPAAPPQAEPAPPAQPPLALTKSVGPLSALDEMFQARDRDHAVSVAPDKSRVRIGKDHLSFRLRSSLGGYLYIFLVGTDRGHFYLLFPNALDKQNRMPKDQEIKLPRPGWSFVAGGPPGTNQFLVMVSEHPRDFSAAGLKRVDPFAEFPLDAQGGVTMPTAGGVGPIAGRVVCPQAGTPCSEAFGAAMFAIEEM